jgi:hypothetical protein
VVEQLAELLARAKPEDLEVIDAQIAEHQHPDRLARRRCGA